MTEISAETVEIAETAVTGFRTPLDTPINRAARRIGGSNWREVERFLRFAVVGVTGAIIDFGTLIIAQATILPPTNDLHVAMATTLAFVIAVVSNFIWTRMWVYPDSRSRSMRRQLSQFFLISVTGWLARTVWITTTYSLIGHALMPALLPIIEVFRPEYIPSPTSEEKLGSIIAQLIAMAFVMLWNFFANRYWTYNDVE